MDRGPIYYVASKYQSHARTAKNYADLLSSKYQHTSLKESKIVILHIEPHDYESIYRQYPALYQKYVIGYCVWEATEIPESYKRSISFIQEIWTCSNYCAQIFRKHHRTVTCIPHLIERTIDYSEEDLLYIKALISHREDYKYYLTITKSWDKRKNTSILIDVFRRMSSKLPKARLIIKDLPSVDCPLYREKNIICINRQLSSAQLNALYSLSSAYVSPHHAEGWGLTISDAMLFRKPIIATGYSGNLEYMTPSNSLMVDFKEEHIHAQDQYYLFAGDMKWAYPDRKDLEDKILWIYHNKDHRSVTLKLEKANEDRLRFTGERIGTLMFERLDALI